MSSGVSGVGTIVGIAVALTIGTAVGGVGLAVLQAGDPPETGAFGVTVGAGGQVTLHHRGGPALDVRTLTIEVYVDGRPLASQPPIPFFAARGFRGGPGGPFNSAADLRWTVGERASFRIASTNTPTVRAGVPVTLRLLKNGRLLWQQTVVAGGSRSYSGAKASVTMAAFGQWLGPMIR
ncbi:MAG: type IV pilin [Halobacteriaceae archaeon]